MKNQRRINGLQLPLNIQQIISWIVLIITAIINFSIITFVKIYKMKIVYLSLFAILYISHIASHVAALIIDPAEKDLRNRKTIEVPEFDRTLHAHVIEDGRCHICNIYTSNKKTKHCGLCNKCVYEFDHHCKWLNNCIGERNYVAFIGCVTTALCISLFTSISCGADVYLLLREPYLMSSEAQKFFNYNSTDTTNSVKYCLSSISFIVFLVILSICGIAMTSAMLHLYCFHVYIYLIGVSTYEYIIKNNNNTQQVSVKHCKIMQLFNKTKEKNMPNEIEAGDSKSKNEASTNDQDTNTTSPNILIDSQLNKANITICTDKNRVHPHLTKLTSQ